MVKKNPCIDSIGNITSKFLKKIFVGYKRINYKMEENCTWACLKKIIDNYTEKDNNISEIREKLFKKYETLKDQIDKIYNILKVQGKRKYTKKMKKGELSFQDFITSESYFLTNLDIFLLADIYKFPFIIISGSTLREKSKAFDRSNIKSKVFSFKQEGKSSYYIIQTTAIQYEGIPKYSIICKDEKSISNTLSSLPVELTRILEDSDEDYNIQKYMDHFDERRYERKKTKKLVQKEG